MRSRAPHDWKRSEWRRRAPWRILLGVMVAAGGVHKGVVAMAGEADVVAAEIRATGGGRYSVSATIRHADAGWDHYADGFDVVAPDGTVLGHRILHHPHVEEQPFTRSLGGIEIPSDVAEVRVRAQDSVHGLGGAEVVIAVPRQ